MRDEAQILSYYSKLPIFSNRADRSTAQVDNFVNIIQYDLLLLAYNNNNYNYNE